MRRREVGLLALFLIASVIVVGRWLRSSSEPTVRPTPTPALIATIVGSPSGAQGQEIAPRLEENPGPPITLEQPADFFSGVVHGLLSPFILLISFFAHDVRMYAFDNVGPRYDLGFLLGFITWLVLGLSRRRT